MKEKGNDTVQVGCDAIYTEALCQDNVDDVLRICDAYLGEGIYTREALEAIMGRTGHHFDLLRCRRGSEPYQVAFGGAARDAQDGIVGVCYCFVCDIAEAADVLGMTEEEVSGLAAAAPGDTEARCGICKSVAVIPPLRGSSLSRDILETYADWMFTEGGAAAAFCVAWVRGGKVPAARQLEQCGFRLIRRMVAPWRGHTSLKCPECGVCPCKCDGMLYTRTRNDHLGKDGTCL